MPAHSGSSNGGGPAGECHYVAWQRHLREDGDDEQATTDDVESGA